ncbi:hypothetical protein HY384_04395 [Candidatus Daviesbacteria bacterium]|nr:hypothetical protein [Candidatus Daviesbacteria bacterium]
MQRTQIYLPEDLRQEVDRLRKGTKESMAEYVRKATQKRVQEDKKKKADLNKLADEVIGSLKIDKKTANRWIKEIREERRLGDQHWEERWDQALNRIKKN